MSPLRAGRPQAMRRPTVLVVAAALALAACSGDDADSVGTAATFETVPTSTHSAPAASDTVVSSVASSDSSAAQPTTPASTAAPTTVPATTPAQLVDPAVVLVEVGSFDRPVDVVVRPNDGRVFAVEQTGSIVAFDDESSEVVADLSDRITTGGNEQGLLGVAFHPSLDLAYVNYTDQNGDTVVAEYTVDPNTGLIDLGSERELLYVSQPYPNHNGGHLAFGPDGMLYIGFGDGGAADDPDREALDLSSPLGKILRIDPAATDDSGREYAVPADNPFAGNDATYQAIWSYGLRNPWRFSFDAATGDLWIADVGQNEFEEINHAPATGGVDAGKGVNFGWSAFEGDEPFNDDQPTDGAVPPVYVYSHEDTGGCSVSGGVVAPADAVGGLAGWYLFGDYCSGQIWALDPSSVSGEPRVVTIAELPGLAAISLGAGGDLYAVSNNGPIARFAPA